MAVIISFAFSSDASALILNRTMAVEGKTQEYEEQKPLLEKKNPI